MDSTYDALDRATIKTWRASNVVGWGGTAVLVAVVVHQVADQLVRSTRASAAFLGTLNDRSFSEFFSTGWAELQRISLPAGVAIIVGFVIGTIVGKKVWRRQALTAAAAAAAYVLVAWLWLENSLRIHPAPALAGQPQESIVTPYHGFPSGRYEWAYASVSLLAVMIAPAWAWFLARRAARRLAGQASA